MKKFIFFLGLVFTSCGVYKTSFDCPPGRGIGCAPVNDVLDMIVEKNDFEEDLFESDLQVAEQLRSSLNIAKQKVAPPKKAQTSLHLQLTKDENGKLVFKEVLTQECDEIVIKGSQ